MLFPWPLRTGHSTRCRGVVTIRLVTKFDAEKNWRLCKKLLIRVCFSIQKIGQMNQKKCWLRKRGVSGFNLCESEPMIPTKFYAV